MSETLRFGLGELAVELEAFPDDQLESLSHLVNLADEAFEPRASLNLRYSRTRERGREIFENHQPMPKRVCCDDVALGYILHRMTTGLLALHDDATCLHGGAVSIDGRLVIVTGDRGAGKTTLLLRLLLDGAAFHCDEYLLARDGVVRTVPRRMHVKTGSLAHLPELADACHDVPLLKFGNGPHFLPIDPMDLGRPWRSARGKPAAIFHLTPAFDAEPVAEAVTQIEMVKRLMCQALSGHRRPGRQAEDVCAIVDGVPCFALRVGAAARTAAVVRKILTGSGG
jgi:hypothetical protein